MKDKSFKEYPLNTRIEVIKTGEKGFAIESVQGLITVKIDNKELIYPLDKIKFI